MFRVSCSSPPRSALCACWITRSLCRACAADRGRHAFVALDASMKSGRALPDSGVASPRFFVAAARASAVTKLWLNGAERLPPKVASSVAIVKAYRHEMRLFQSFDHAITHPAHRARHLPAPIGGGAPATWLWRGKGASEGTRLLALPCRVSTSSCSLPRCARKTGLNSMMHSR